MKFDPKIFEKILKNIADYPGASYDGAYPHFEHVVEIYKRGFLFAQEVRDEAEQIAQVNNAKLNPSGKQYLNYLLIKSKPQS